MMVMMIAMTPSLNAASLSFGKWVPPVMASPECASA
jgi:hypothetical protein